MVTMDNVSDRQTRSECCDGRITVVVKQFRSSGNRVVFQCGRCENMYVLGNQRPLCKGCSAELTSTDWEAGRCTQCNREIVR